MARGRGVELSFVLLYLSIEGAGQSSRGPLAAHGFPFTLLRTSAMLDYVKVILLKVSFNKALFEKELRKALRMLLPTELPDFRTWCYQQFSRLYRRVLKRVFGELSPVA